MAQHIVVKKYSHKYPKMYEEEKVRIESILKDNLVSIYHIGSTSVPNLKSKPIIDIMISVNSLEMVDEKKDEFIKIGYEYLGEFGIKGRRYLRKGGDERTHQIHIFSKNDESNLKRHLAAKLYLIKYPEVAKIYGDLKEDLAKRYPFNIEAYCDGKDSFMKVLEKKALEEFNDLKL